MAIDTLILSGGSTKGMAYLGSIKYLIDNNIIDFKSLKHIITASIGSFMIIPFLLKIDIHIIYKIFIKTKVNMFDLKDFDISSLFKDLGCFENSQIQRFIKTLCKYFHNNENMTLKEFYEISKIKYTVKVSNINKHQIEYINYENYPEMPLHIVCKMATAVPFVLKPVKYNNYLYCDGATNLGLPIEYLELQENNYLGIIVSGKKNKKHLIKGKYEKINNLLDYLNSIFDIYNHCNEQNTFIRNKKIIFIYLDKKLCFNIDEEEKKKFILEGYNQTKSHIKKYFIDS